MKAKTAKNKKRKKPRALTPLSVKLLEARGYTVGKVEQRLPIPGKFVTRDFCGFADLIAFKGPGTAPGIASFVWDSGIFAVQVTSASNLASRSIKIRDNPKAREWLRSTGRIILHGWRENGTLIEKEIKEP
jgi:hypothetical protein